VTFLKLINYVIIYGYLLIDLFTFLTGNGRKTEGVTKFVTKSDKKLKMQPALYMEKTTQQQAPDTQQTTDTGAGKYVTTDIEVCVLHYHG
jgi:hypothetical protein